MSETSDDCYRCPVMTFDREQCEGELGHKGRHWYQGRRKLFDDTGLYFDDGSEAYERYVAKYKDKGVRVK